MAKETTEVSHLSDATIAEVERLDALALPGPCYYDTYNTVACAIKPGEEEPDIAFLIVDHPNQGEWGDLNDPAIATARSGWYKKTAALAELLALARTALPDAIREIKRLREEIDQLNKLLATAASAGQTPHP